MLRNNTFFIDAANRYPHVLQQLQSSCGSTDSNTTDDITKNPFMVLLSNAVKNTIDFQALTAGEMDGPVNQYGTSITYRRMLGLQKRMWSFLLNLKIQDILKCICS